jgi:hypothetical protein
MRLRSRLCFILAALVIADGPIKSHAAAPKGYYAGIKDKIGGNLTVTWLGRLGVTYAVQSAANPAASFFAKDKTMAVVDGPTEPAAPSGYTRRQFTVPAVGSKFYRVVSIISSP